MFENSNEWFRGMEVSVGPDAGAIYGLDWSDTYGNAMITLGCIEPVEEFKVFSSEESGGRFVTYEKWI